MKKEKIRRYRKTELLELLIRLREENDELRAELELCRSKLADKNIAISSAGSIADAAMRLSGIFEAAQAACDQYTQNMAQRAEQPREQEDDLFDGIFAQLAGSAGRDV